MPDGDRVPNITLDEHVISGARNEKQSVKVDGTGGTFQLTFDGEATAKVAFNASTAVLREALEALPQLDSGDVVVTGGPGNAGGTTPYVVEFTGDYAATDVPTLVAAPADELTGGAGTVTVTVLQTGREENPDAVKRGTGLADRETDTSVLTTDSPAADRVAHPGDYD